MLLHGDVDDYELRTCSVCYVLQSLASPATAYRVCAPLTTFTAHCRAA